MLRLHCGWPRTSTTSLQNALFGCRGELVDAGLLYPEKWIAGGASHHGLFELLGASPKPEGGLDDFKHFLSDHAERDIVFSVEGITYLLSSTEKLEAVLRLLAAAGEVMPVECVWTLRRLDETLVSFYLLRLALGFDLPPPEEFFPGARPGRGGCSPACGQSRTRLVAPPPTSSTSRAALTTAGSSKRLVCRPAWPRRSSAGSKAGLASTPG
jgi:hypothetical protein